MNMSNRLVKSGVPLVYQLSEIFRLKIANGELQPNDPFPTEEQISKTYGVSRMTVRLALAKLVNEGFIRRQQGVGSFVNPKGLVRADEVQPVTRDMSDVKSTTNILESAGKIVGTKVLTFSLDKPAPRIAEQLDISEAEHVFHFERLRLADGEPVVLEKIWIPERICSTLSKADVEGSVYRVLADRFGLNVMAAHQALRAEIADEALASVLGVAAGAPIMRVAGVSYTDAGTPVEVEESWFRSDMMEFIIELGSLSTYARLIED
ncbi:GntR family transcriptional regulator [Rhizobium petrolearium]|uniref:GntR family transcriptional regulator n=1 Tax=Neorhizobium petrolearium TaxID=515361 RepID=UPI001AE34469|nr:GntR family transcriptional regulator [Neorhizobium petrolearium]MBP1848134.1 GntR family transcriptional regulator [Neorhizobium petrolearium]